MWRTLALALISGLLLTFMDLCKRNTRKQIETTKPSFNDTPTERTEILKEILREIDATLTEEDLVGIIEEVDEDGSGTLDFDEFQEMMMG